MGRESNGDAISIFDQMAAELGLFNHRPKRRKNSWIYWRVPKNWTKTTYLFGYTPWRTRHDGKKGFFALKYRQLKNGTRKLVKAVRFGRRKIAKARSLKWHNKYYR